MLQVLAVFESSTHERQPVAWPPLAQLPRLTNTVVDNGTAEPSDMPPASHEPLISFAW